MRAFLGLGSNVGDRRAHLRGAIDALRASGELVAVSSLFETEPVGGPEQGPVRNLVVELDTVKTPHELLAECQRLEQDAQRVRIERWGPRTLDVDVLWVDGVTLDEPDLQIPHPRMFERRFVLAPLAQLASDVVPDGWEGDAVGDVTDVGPL